MDPVSSTLVGSLIGLGASAVNGYISYKTTIANNDHEFRMVDRKAAAAIRQHEAKAGDEEHARVIEHDAKLDGLRGLIRPLLTLIWTAGFLLIGLAGIAGWIPGFDMNAWLAAVLGMAALVNGYWFGQRSLAKHLPRPKNSS